jgi:hypothetical protein
VAPLETKTRTKTKTGRPPGLTDGADHVGAIERAETAQLMEEAESLGIKLASTLGRLCCVVGELDRRQGFRSEGATSVAAWVAERLGVAESSGRSWSTVAEKLYDLPRLAEAMCDGVLSFDKGRTVATIASPETEAGLIEVAKTHSVRQLGDMVRSAQGPSVKNEAISHEQRFLRFDDGRGSIIGKFSPEHYQEVRTAITYLAKDLPTDVQTSFDQRCADALTLLCRGMTGTDSGNHSGPGTRSAPTTGSEAHPEPDIEADADTDTDTDTDADADTDARSTTQIFTIAPAAPYLIVLHADLSYLRGEGGIAELERGGLLSREAALRLSCDASISLAIDDAFGRTMAEGRAKRLATAPQRREVQRRDRRCRFPGCANSIFTDIHHIRHWTKGGLTDLDNLVTLCDHHHRRLHADGWHMKGDANAELTFIGPSGRAMTSLPSPLWGRRRTGPSMGSVGSEYA